MAKPVTMTSGRSIDWLAMARVHADLAVKEFRGDSSYDLRLGTFLAVINPLDERAQHATIAKACIAMHNAEREQERAYATPAQVELAKLRGMQNAMRPEQPQPFDCEEAADSITNILSNTGGLEWSHVRDYLRDYVRSLNIPVKE